MCTEIDLPAQIVPAVVNEDMDADRPPVTHEGLYRTVLRKRRESRYQGARETGVWSMFGQDGKIVSMLHGSLLPQVCVYEGKSAC